MYSTYICFKELHIHKKTTPRSNVRILTAQRTGNSIVTEVFILVPRALLTRGQRRATRGSGQTISNWHLIGYNEGYCCNTGYILLPCFYGTRKKGSGLREDNTSHSRALHPSGSELYVN
jgi:hypothetical protein